MEKIHASSCLDWWHRGRTKLLRYDQMDYSDIKGRTESKCSDAGVVKRTGGEAILSVLRRVPEWFKYDDGFWSLTPRARGSQRDRRFSTNSPLKTKDLL